MLQTPNTCILGHAAGERHAWIPALLLKDRPFLLSKALFGVPESWKLICLSQQAEQGVAGGWERATFSKDGGRFSHNICAASRTPPWRGRWSHPSAGPAANPSGVHLNGKSGLQGSFGHTLSPEEELSTFLFQPWRSLECSGTFLQPCCSKCNRPGVRHHLGSCYKCRLSGPTSLKSTAKCHVAMEIISTMPE